MGALDHASLFSFNHLWYGFAGRFGDGVTAKFQGWERNPVFYEIGRKFHLDTGKGELDPSLPPFRRQEVRSL